jgi:hypothetical protein
VVDGMDKRQVLPRQQGDEQQQLRDDAPAVHLLVSFWPVEPGGAWLAV